MRVVRLVLSFLLILSFSPRLNSQQSSPPATKRDPLALAVLAQMVIATGWTAGAVPTTMLASGTLSRPGDSPPTSSSFVIKQRGASQHRMDLQDSTATSTTVVNGLAGSMRLPDGTKQRLPAHGALSVQSPAFPFLSDLVNSADLSIEIQNLGTNTIDGAACQGVGIVRHAPATDPFAKFRDRAAPLKVWISLQSGLPVRIDFIRLSDDNPYVAMNFSRSFSDYRVVNGIAVPFQQTESFEGQLMYQIQFTAVQFNAAVTDADFDSSNL